MAGVAPCTTAAAAGPRYVPYFVLMVLVAGVLSPALTFAAGAPIHNLFQVLANYVLLVLLCLGYLVWLARAARGRVSGETGAGFLVAAYGVVLRAHCEFLVTLVGSTAYLRETGSLDWVALARAGGFVAVAFGVSMVVASCIAERRLAREARAPA